MRKFAIFVFALLLIFAIGCKTTKDQGPLQVSTTNPRYFTNYSGKAVYLTGMHTWNNLVEMKRVQDEKEFDYDNYLDLLEAYNHNFFRLWAWDLLTWNTTGNRDSRSGILNIYPQPYQRIGAGNALDGKPKFDLSQYNPEYFERLKLRIQLAEERNIYVAVMLFEGWGIQFSPEGYQNHPYHPSNNINELGLSESDSLRLEIYTLKHDKVTRLQEAYVKKVIETVNEFDNVLYEISNENNPVSTEWQYHMINFIKETEAEMGNSHPVGMTFQYRGGSNQDLFNSPADWISPNAAGGYQDNPPLNDGIKVIIPDTDHMGGIWGTRPWVWKSFFRGLNPIFMDIYYRNVLEKNIKLITEWPEEVRVAMGQTRVFAEKIDLINSIPDRKLSSTEYCISVPGKEYLVYLPDTNKVSINLQDDPGEFTCQWFNTISGVSIKGETITGGKPVELETPFFTAETIVHLVKK